MALDALFPTVFTASSVCANARAGKAVAVMCVVPAAQHFSFLAPMPAPASASAHTCTPHPPPAPAAPPDTLNRPYSALTDGVTSEELSSHLRREGEGASELDAANAAGSRNRENRLNRYAGGRMALRRAIRSALAASASESAWAEQSETFHLLTGSTGAPLLPAGAVGSVSHKGHLALGMALAAPSAPEEECRHVGCDVEQVRLSSAAGEGKEARLLRLAKRVLSAEERGRVGQLKGSEVPTHYSSTHADTRLNAEPNAGFLPLEEELLLMFSLKESVFKALHPLLQRQIDWSEVEVRLGTATAGVAHVTLRLRSLPPHSRELSSTAAEAGAGAGAQTQTQKLNPGQGQGQMQRQGRQRLRCEAQFLRYQERGRVPGGSGAEAEEEAAYWLTFAQVCACGDEGGGGSG